MTPTLTKREVDIMAIIWRLGSATVGEIVEHLSDDLHYSTILTMCRTLESKGHIGHELKGRAFHYSAITQPEAAGDSALGRLVSKVFQGSREMLMARLVSGEDVTPEELRRMRYQLDERLKELDQ